MAYNYTRPSASSYNPRTPAFGPVDPLEAVRKAEERAEHFRREFNALRHDFDNRVKEDVRAAQLRERTEYALREQHLQATIAQLSAEASDKQAAHAEQLRVAQGTIDGLRLQLDHTIAAHREEIQRQQALLALAQQLHVNPTVKSEPA